MSPRRVLVCLLAADLTRRAIERAYETGHADGFALGQLDGTMGTLAAVARFVRGGAR